MIHNSHWNHIHNTEIVNTSDYTYYLSHLKWIQNSEFRIISLNIKGLGVLDNCLVIHCPAVLKSAIEQARRHIPSKMSLLSQAWWRASIGCSMPVHPVTVSTSRPTTRPVGKLNFDWELIRRATTRPGGKLNFDWELIRRPRQPGLSIVSLVIIMLKCPSGLFEK
jgi:hypothetical protein